MKKTKLTRSLLAAVSVVALSAVMYGCVHDGGDAPEPMVEPMPDPMPEPMPMDASGDIMLTAEQSAALLGVLPDNGDTVELTVDADGTTRAGVTFTCESDYPCTVTVSNSASTIVATWASQTLGDGTASAMASGLEPAVDTFANLNDGSVLTVRNLVTAQDGTTTAPTLTATELIGMGIGGPGALTYDMAGLRSDFQANGADLAAPGTAAAPGASPTLTMGTTITGADDTVDTSADMAPAPDGWDRGTWFRDWGDTAGDGDGGFETAAIVLANAEEGTPHPFDRDLSDMYVNAAAQAMFALAIRADGSAPGVTTLGTSVYIGVDANTDVTPNLPAAMSVQWANMEFDGGSLVPAQSQDLNVNTSETFRGTYFGAPGEFQCIAADTTNCAIARGDDGIIRVNDTNADPDVVASTGRWSFTPDPGAMITVPDQDWMAYGAWLTTPDDMAGDHRLGVFFNGMDPWAPATNALDATTNNALRGSATYSGGATGVYVDGMDSGLFTARAMLTATFDRDSTGTLVAADDFMISGRIDNFRGTDGVALGADTGDMPNPQGRGENDWVVELGAFNFQTTTTGVIDATATTGSADGVSWTGSWNGQLFGPSGTEMAPMAPSGVAGRFWAETADADPASQTDNMPATAVVGAFGATMDMDDDS